MNHVLMVVLATFARSSYQHNLQYQIPNNFGRPTSLIGACAPTFHTRHRLWIDPCQALREVGYNAVTSLRCDGPFGLSIVGAKYGPKCAEVDTSNRCIDSCQSITVVDTIRDVCGSKLIWDHPNSTCRVQANERLFRNPCPDRVPVLFISISCEYSVRTLVPFNALISRQSGAGQSILWEGGGSPWGRRKRQTMTVGPFRIAVIDNDRSAIEFFDSPNDPALINFSGIEANPCWSLGPLNPPGLNSTLFCASSNSVRGGAGRSDNLHMVMADVRSYFDHDLLDDEFSMKPGTDLDMDHTQQNYDVSVEQDLIPRQSLLGTSPLLTCPCSNNGQIIFSNGSVSQGLVNGFCFSLSQAGARPPCFCSGLTSSACFDGERCCSQERTPCTSSVATTTTISPTSTTTAGPACSQPSQPAVVGTSPLGQCPCAFTFTNLIQGTCFSSAAAALFQPCQCGPVGGDASCFVNEQCCSQLVSCPGVLAITTSQTNIDCNYGAANPGDPAGTVVATGGSPPYFFTIASTDGNFLIAGPTGELTVDRTLSPGTYPITVVVSDQAGLTASTQVNVVQNCALTSPLRISFRQDN